MRRITLSALLTFSMIMPALAQHAHPGGRAIDFPDPDGYLALTCDLHIHTVFSDGSVWPDIRVQEAQRDGLDCIAMTEHIEYQPHSADIPHPDRNRSFDVATNSAGNSDLIVLRGSEITRSMPPGHSNAIFVQDANALLVDGAREAFEVARGQGAFTFWNHPDWPRQRSDGIATLTDLHRELIAEGLIQGIEVVNGPTYSAEAFQIALDNDLAVIGTTDVHGLVDWDYDVNGAGHRSVTIVLAQERSVEGIREALMDLRTVAYQNGNLFGREAHVRPVVETSLAITGARYAPETEVLIVDLENVSDAPYVLMNQSGYTFMRNTDLIVIEPHSSRSIEVKTVELLAEITLRFDVVNALIGPSRHLGIELAAPVESVER